MAFIQANWHTIVLVLVGALTLIQEVLGLMGHSSGAISGVISFLNSLSGTPANPAAPTSPPKA